MRNHFTKWIPLFLLFFSGITKGDDSYLSSLGGNVFPDKSSDIRMIKEDVHIQLLRDSCNVICQFWFFNEGEQQTILMGFPNFESDPLGFSQRLRNFKCIIRSKEILTALKSQKVYFENDTTMEIYHEWFSWPVNFAKRETLYVRNTYTGDWGASAYGNCSFSYLIGTGRTWKGPIKEGRITFDFSQLATSQFLDTTFSRESKQGMLKNIYEDSTVYHFKNYIPDSTETLEENFIYFWKRLYGIEDQFDIIKRNHPTIKEIRLMRNEIFARHGYVFQDQTLANFFSSKKWYRPDPGFKFSDLNSYEKHFIEQLKQLEKQSQNKPE